MSEYTFPLLAKALPDDYSDAGFVVLFTDYNKGTVVKECDGATYPLGMYSDEWASVHDNKIWQVLDAGLDIIEVNKERYKSLDETSYLHNSQANSKRLIRAVTRFDCGDVIEKELVELDKGDEK